MSYAIIRNEKLTRSKAIGAYNHNERKTKNHANKNIDSEKTYLNYYLKKNQLSYIKEFDRIHEKYNLKGQIKTTSNIMCEMLITSDTKFFENIGYEESKRYFTESYNFICNYKNIREQNIISAVVHMDEDTAHMHLLFIPVVNTRDKQGNSIDKVSCRDFWHGKNTYGQLQDKFYDNISSKGFKLERGQPKEVTQNEHIPIEQLKKITNYENTKKIMQNIKLELPDVPSINDFSKIMYKRDEKIQKDIIKPKDNLIKELYSDNINLHKELSKQAKVIGKAEIFEKEQDKILADNKELHNKCEKVEGNYNNRVYELEKEFEVKTVEFKREVRQDYYELQKENRKLKRIVSTVKNTINKFIKWVCRKFDMSAETVMRDFEKENHICLDPMEQSKREDRQRDNEMER